MFDSLPYRNDAAQVFRRLIRSLPQRRGVIGVATCDKGLPAMLMALAAMRDLPDGDRARAVSPCRRAMARMPARCRRSGRAFRVGCSRSRKLPTWAAARARRPVVAASFSAPPRPPRSSPRPWGSRPCTSALAPSGQPVWLDIARRAARLVTALDTRGLAGRDILTSASIRNAMVVHAAFGGSTNLLLHIPAIAHAARSAAPDRR
jgi:hypothetical protein